MLKNLELKFSAYPQTQLTNYSLSINHVMVHSSITRTKKLNLFVAQVENLNMGWQNNQIKPKFLKKVLVSKDHQIKTYFAFPNIPDIFSASKDQILYPINLEYIKCRWYYFEEFDMSNID